MVKTARCIQSKVNHKDVLIENLNCIFTGECVCHENYTGIDCSDDIHYVVTIYDLPSNGLCDKLYRPCEQVTVYGDNFIDNINLTCQLQVQNVGKNIRFRMIITKIL